MNKNLHVIIMVGISAIIIMVIIILIVFKMRKSKIIGDFGEKTMARILNRLPNRRYKVIHDVILRTANGTTQIDHIVVSRYGIFIIETKNYKGDIRGSEFGEYWTQTLTSGSYTFYNPIKQNAAHVYALRRLLSSYENIRILSIIAFSNHCSLYVKSESYVVPFSKVRYIIKKYRRKKIKKKDVFVISELIKENSLDTRRDKRKHTNYVKKQTKMNEKNIQKKICPRCGNRLKKRYNRYGTYLRCKRYPDCRYTHYKHIRKKYQS